jgi:uncharacterized caspase-like protein
MTNLEAAVLNNKTDAVRLLLEYGADFRRADRHAMTPLMYAKQEGNKEMIRLLQDAEANAPRGRAPAPLPPAAAPGTAPPSDVDDPPAPPSAKRRDAYAIVIGIEKYRQKLPSADFAVNDAKTVAKYLTTTLGFRDENVVLLTDENAALGDFAKYIEQWLANRIEKDGLVFVYYSGHGAPNPSTGDAFLVPYDGDPAFINQTGFSLKRLYAALSKLPARHVVVALDSCFSGAGGRSVIAAGTRPLVTKVDNAPPSARNMAVLSAASGEQTSSTYHPQGHGLFTYFFLKSIKDAAQADAKDPLDIRRLFSAIKPEVEKVARREYNNEQTPVLFSAEGQGIRLRE